MKFNTLLFFLAFCEPQKVSCHHELLTFLVFSETFPLVPRFTFEITTKQNSRYSQGIIYDM